MVVSNRIVILILCTFLWTDCFSQASINDKSLNTVDGLIEAYFNRISGPAERDSWESFQSLFLPTAQINAIGINENGENDFYPQNLLEYIKHLKKFTEASGFYQRNLKSSNIEYARMAQVFSVYESYNEPSGELLDRGLISFHLIRKKERWWIANVLWNSETRQHPLPADILEY